MAINTNLAGFALGSRLKVAMADVAGKAPTAQPNGGGIGLPVTPPAAPAPPPTAPPPAFTRVRPGLLAELAGGPLGATPGISVFTPVFTPQPRTTTQLARAAIDQLSRVAPAALREAINAIRSRNLAPGTVMNFLERKVRVGEVLGQNAKDWSDQTKADFADAFQMQRDRLDAMDSIVSVAILNDDDLEDELRGENLPDTTPGDLMQNRRVVWQWPPAGTVLSPPYVVLVAVDYQDVASADQVVRSILDQLGTFETFKLPKAALGRV